MARQDTKKQVSSTTLQEQVINQLMTFNKCTRERAVHMYTEMMQVIADHYLLDSVSSTTLEIDSFASHVCEGYGLIQETKKQLLNKLK
jgi:hypothetical protein